MHVYESLTDINVEANDGGRQQCEREQHEGLLFLKKICFNAASEEVRRRVLFGEEGERHSI